jgi:uncharacterized protein YcbX
MSRRVIQLWRYPVKSFLGERLDEASFGPNGVEGDRGFAIRDKTTGHGLSAKKHSILLTARARMTDGDVTLMLPGGSDVAVSDPAIHERLSVWLGRDVVFEHAPGGTGRPEIEGDNGIFRGRAGGFFDSSAVHIVTTSTLRRFTEWHPDGLFDARRFRPNIVLATTGEGFVEEGWLGDTLRVGEVAIEITKPCSRCVMTTHAMEDLPVDRDILRTVNARNDEHVGVYGIVRVPGVVRVGDEASILA